MSETMEKKSTIIVNTMDRGHEAMATPQTTPENEDHKTTPNTKTAIQDSPSRTTPAVVSFSSFAILILVNTCLGVAPNVPAHVTIFSFIVILTWLSRRNGLPFTETLSEEDSLYRFEKSSQTLAVHIGAQMGKSSSLRRDIGVFLIIIIFFGFPHGIGQIQLGNSCTESSREKGVEKMRK